MYPISKALVSSSFLMNIRIIIFIWDKRTLDIVAWPESTLDIALWVKSKMANILRSIFVDRIKVDWRFLFFPMGLSGTPDIVMRPEKHYRYCVMGKIEELINT